MCLSIKSKTPVLNVVGGRLSLLITWTRYNFCSVIFYIVFLSVSIRFLFSFVGSATVLTDGAISWKGIRFFLCHRDSFFLVV